MRISLGFRFLWLLSFGLCLFGLHAQAQPQTGTFHQVNITADEQSFDEEGRTRFTGDVRVAYKDIRIKSNLATLEMNAVGEPDVATFYNRPLAQRLTPPDGEDNLEADTIKFLINDNKMVAEGNAVSYVTSVAANPVTIHSELQEFDNVAKIVKAQGSVKVDYDATKIYSPTATLWVDEKGKAKRVVFSGGARAEQEQSEIVSEKLTIMVGSGNLLAENNVKTNVKTESTSPDSPGRVFIDSDFQQYDKASDTMLASGNVRIRYGDYRAAGPKATFKMKGGGVDKIFITGRANIITNGRQVEADKIVITTSPKHFDAVGNVKSKFLAKSVDPTPSSSSSGGPSKLPPNSKKPAATAATSQPPDPKAPPDEKRPDDDYLD